MTAGSNRPCYAAFSPRPLASITQSSLFQTAFFHPEATATHRRALAASPLSFFLFAGWVRARRMPYARVNFFLIYAQRLAQVTATECAQCEVSRTNVRKFSHRSGGNESGDSRSCLRKLGLRLCYSKRPLNREQVALQVDDSFDPRRMQASDRPLGLAYLEGESRVV